MQEIRHDGSRGETLLVSDQKDIGARLIEKLNKIDVKEVRVFNNPNSKTEETEESIIKKSIAYSNKQIVPKITRAFRLQKGMRVTINQALYKVTASRPNGKVTMKFIKTVEKT